MTQYSEAHQLRQLSSEEQEKLQLYFKTLSHWNQRFNLVSRASLKDQWSRHVSNSLSLLPYIAEPVIDIGSGAGLPAVILAIVGVKDLSLVEASQKKAIFLRHLAAVLDLQIKVINARAETLMLSGQTIISRACSDVNTLLAMVYKYQYHHIVLLKGQRYAAEIAKAQLRWQFDYQVCQGEQTIILKINNLKVK